MESAKTLGHLLLDDSRWRSSLRRRLLTWYRHNARDLPWRRTRDPYRIWVSEVMLQQTQVATVKPYYRRFLRTFPHIAALAEADEEQVLRLWEGLGYYRRARQLHAAAKIITSDYDGRFPRDPRVLRQLPGVGRYTAGAILSIAFDDRHPILEANTIRLFCRLLAYPEQPTRAPGQALLWDAAERLLPRKNCGLFNQALMELGSTICAPRAPQCDVCPVRESCLAWQEGIQDQLPVRKPPTKFEDVSEVAVVVRRRDHILLRRCQDGERWAGLWDFPRSTCEHNGRKGRSRQIVANVRRQTGIAIQLLRHLTTIQHGVTRYRITLDCFEATAKEPVNGTPVVGETKWVDPSDLHMYPLSTTGRQISRLIS